MSANNLALAKSGAVVQATAKPTHALRRSFSLDFNDFNEPSGSAIPSASGPVGADTVLTSAADMSLGVAAVCLASLILGMPLSALGIPPRKRTERQ